MPAEDLRPFDPELSHWPIRAENLSGIQFPGVFPFFMAFWLGILEKY